jgi:uncharacterized protein YbaP (TraB family)
VGRKTCRRFLGSSGAALGLLCCLSFGWLTAHAASPVWAIHGDHNTVYLAGSVHLLKANDSALPAAFNRAYTGSHSLVMELDLGKMDPMAAAGWMAEHGVLPEGKTLQQVLGDARYQRVSTEAGRLGVPMEMIQQFAPWVLGLQLLEMQYQKEGFDSESGVEQQLEHRAQADGKPTAGLETLEQQLGFFEALTPEQQTKFLDLVLKDLHDDSESETQQVITAWRAGDATKLAALLSDEYQQFPALYQSLVTERNRHWEPQIQKMLHDNDNYFVVVGALHLVGQGGLLELLRKDGYKIEQLN